MTRKNTPPISLSNEDIEEWYTAGQAAKKLTENSKREVLPAYVSKLAGLGKIRTKKIHERLVLYAKDDIDNYRVESRGKKSGAAKRKGTTGPTVREQRRAKKEQAA